jgi:hypothetical protein
MQLPGDRFEKAYRPSSRPPSAEGATKYGDNRLGTFEPDRVRVSGPFSFRAKPIFLAPAFTHPLQSSFPLEAPLNGANGTQAGSLCYINAVASSLQVHGDSSRDSSRRSLDSPEGQCSIGFRPVFCSHVEQCSTLLARLNCVPSSCGFGCHRYHTGMLKPTLGGNYEYFHLQTLSDADFFEPSSACDFI